MQIEGHVQALREDLARVAALGDESTGRAAQLLSVALESSFGRRMLEALNEAALELSGQLRTGRVEVRLSGSDPQLVVVDEEHEEPGGACPASAGARETPNVWHPRSVRPAGGVRRPRRHPRRGHDRRPAPGAAP